MTNKQKDKLASNIISLLTFLILSVLAFIIIYILSKGVKVINLHFLTSPSSDFVKGSGIGPQLFNSFYLLILTLIISFPLSLGAAIYLSEYAPKSGLTDVIRTSIEVLSSLPSIVVGLFGFLIFVIKFSWGFSIISGAFTLCIFNLPIMVRIIEQALNNVDSSKKEAVLSLGLTKWEGTKSVLIPEVLPSIVTGIILASGRIFGEAAALIYTAGQSAPRLDFSSFDLTSLNCPWNIFRPAETLAVHIWKVNSEGIVPDAKSISDGTAAVLIILVLVFNISARILSKYVYSKMTGSK